MRFTSVFVLASLVVSSFGATVADVTTDIGAVHTQLDNLVAKINAFPVSGGSLTQALAIHTATGPVTTALDKTTSDSNAVTPLPISTADGRTILTALEGLEPNIDAALNGIVARKPAFDRLPLGGVTALARQDLNTLRTSTTNLENALISKSPASLLAEATAFRNRVDAAFATAIAAYN